MITDGEQKLYRVLFNIFAKERQMPTWEQLQSKTGLPKAQLMERLLRLQEAGKLLWDDQDTPQTVILIQQPFLQSEPKRPSAATYFTDY